MKFFRIFLLLFLINMISFSVDAQGLVPGMRTENGQLAGGNFDVGSRTTTPTSSTSFVDVMDAFTLIGNGCWFCGIHRFLLQAINDFSARLSGAISGYAIGLLALGFAFFILFKVLQAFVSFGEIEPKKFLTELFKPFVMTILAIIVIINLSSFYEYVVTPLTKISVAFSDIIYTSSNVNFTRTTYSSGRISGVSSVSGCACTSDDDCTPVTTTNGIGLSNEVNTSIQCFMRQVSTSLIIYIATGATFISNCWGAFLPNWTMLGVGLCLFIACFAIFISFPLRLIDAVVRLMFVCALMPLWIVLWVLPATRSKSVAAFNMFLGAMVTFVCMSIIMLMVLHILASILGMTPGEQDTFFNTYLLGGQTEKALAIIDWGRASFFSCLGTSVLALALTQKAESFASQFVRSSSLGVGANMEKWTMAAAALPVNKIVRPMVKRGFTSLGKSLGKKKNKNSSSEAS